MEEEERNKKDQPKAEGNGNGKRQKKKKWYAGLNPRRRRLIENLLSGKFKSKKDAMIDAGYTKSTAIKAPQVIIGNVRNLTAMQQALEEIGINDLRLARKIETGLDATKVISAIVIAPTGEEMKEASGITKDFIEVPDFHAQHKFLETALNLRGDFPSEKKEGILTIETHEQRLERLKEKIGRQL